VRCVQVGEERLGEEVVGEAGAGMRARAKELALMVAEAVGEGGSSRRELDGLVEELRELGSLG